MAEWFEGKRLLNWAAKLDFRSANVLRLAEEIRSIVDHQDPGYDHIEDILHFVKGNSEAFPSALLTTLDAVFYRNIMNRGSRQLLDQANEPFRLTCGMEFDSAIRRQGTPPTVGEICNIIAMSEIKPTKGVAILATARDDGPYLLEWIAHHRVLGVEHFFVYSNDNTDSSDKLLAALASNGVLTYVENQIGRSVHPSIKSYTHALNFVPAFRSYKWAFVLDSDEFVWLTSPLSMLLDQIDKSSDRSAPCLFLNWRWIGSNVLRFSDEPLRVRFRHSKRDNHVKSLFRTRDAIRIFSHHPLLKSPFKFMDSNLVERDLVTELNKFCTYGSGEVLHYWQRSLEEYSIKVARGRGRAGYERGFEEFFAWNVKHEEATLLRDESEFARKVDLQIEHMLGLPGVEAARKCCLRLAAENMARNRNDLGLDQVFEDGMRKHPWIAG